MSAEHASLLLDVLDVDGEGVAPRLDALFGEHGTLHELDRDDQATALLAQLLAKDSFSGVSAERAGLLLDVLADVWGLQLRAAGTPAVLAEDLDAALPKIIEDLEDRVQRLPRVDRERVRRRIAGTTKGRRAQVRFLPVDTLAVFAHDLANAEAHQEQPA